jgi:hypothetical protein
MRTQFLYVGLLGMMAGGLVSTGCDDIHTGQLSDPSGPVKLIRLMVQDSEPFAQRGGIVDLLDTKGSPLSTAVACDDVNPCGPQFTLGGTNPDFSCGKTGFCNDPLSPEANPVALIGFPVGDPGEAGGTQIRFVFNKLLNSSFETVTIDPSKTAGSNDKKFALAKGVAELDDPMGMPVALFPGSATGGWGAYWDPTGSPLVVADPVRTAFGPAIVLKPADMLAPNVTYTAKLTASMVTDRKGNPMADQNGNVVAGTYTKTFKTENIQNTTAAIGGTDVTAKGGAMIAPNDVLSLNFNAHIDETSVMCTVAQGSTPVTVLAFSERGSDPTMCAKPAMGMVGAPNDDTVLLIFPSSSTDAVTATPTTGWAAGDYTIHCTGKDNVFGMGTFDVMGTFTVAGMAGDPKKDALAIDNHQFPSQCTK